MKWNLQGISEERKENLVTTLYLGSIFILLAVVYSVNAAHNLVGNVESLFSTFTLAQVPGTSVALPAPVNPTAYMTLYIAVFQFCLGLGILEMMILALRITLHSPMTRKAETIENLVFWLGTSYLAITYLVNMTIISDWFVFWAGVILIGGLSLIARSFVLFFKRQF